LNLAIFSTAGAAICRVFIANHYDELKRQGLKCCIVVLDKQADKKEYFLKHSIKIAKRQSKYANCSWMLQYLNILFFKVMTSNSARAQCTDLSLPGEIKVFEVRNLNSLECIEAVTTHGCDAICLMGTRIITPKTLERFSDANIFNIHSADPAFVRGGPSVFWEVLAGKRKIVATIHRVLAEVDSGEIYAQREIPIAYNADLGMTLSQTRINARPVIADLFFEVLQAVLRNDLSGKYFEPGKLRVTPSVFDVLKAKRLCRKSSAQ